MNIGWDIGIKNLSYCILDNNSNIIEWDIIDITDNEEFMCCFHMKSGKTCNKLAKKIDRATGKFYCNMHRKKDNLHDFSFCFECKNKAKKKNKQNEFYCLKHSKTREGMYDIKLNKHDLNTIGNKLIKKLNEKKKNIGC